MSDTVDTKVYTIEEVANVSGASIPVINRWSAKLRASKALCKEGKRVWYTMPFIKFVHARANAQGPSNLPSDDDIVKLMDAYIEYGPDVDKIAATMRLPAFIVRGQLEIAGLDE